MVNLRSTLKLAHSLLEQNGVSHALIGGLALACYGSTRATVDLDLIADEIHKEKIKTIFTANGFRLVHESIEVLQFSGIGNVDIILARRPISKKILADANPDGPEQINFVKCEDLIGLKIQAYANDSSRELQDKADIQFLIENVKELDWDKIKNYADLFNQWEVINDIKNKIKF